MNRLLDHIITERKGHYCHALELDSAYSYECVIEQIVSEYKDSFTLEEIKEFFNTIELYYLADDDNEWVTDERARNKIEDEVELYSFDYIQCINDCYY